MKQMSSFRALKGLVTLALIALGTSYASAQYYVNVMQKDGTRIQYSVDDIEQVSITDYKLPDFKAESVDLGLSVRWATCNIGANQANEKGWFVRWGETSEMVDTIPYKWYDLTTDKYTKYNLYERMGTVDMKYRLDAADDVANSGAGPQWRIPSIEEFQELIDSCNWALVDSGRVKGYLVTSKKNGNNIFLPTAGFSMNGNIYYPEHIGAYLSNTLRIVSNSECRLLFFNLDTVYLQAFSRQIGLSVRPVYSSDFGNNILQVSGVELDTASLKLKAGQNYTLQVTGKMPDNTTIKLGAVEWSTSDKNVAVVEDGEITAVGEGTCTITVSFGGKTASCAVAVIDPSKPQDPVDLGLSVKWSTINIGASAPYEAGDYYAWGETTIKNEYSWATYKYCNGEDTSITKYNSYAQYGHDGFIDGLTVLEPDDDVAYVKWKGNWRMPLDKEFQELVDSCTWVWIEMNGMAGYKITSNVEGYTDNSIFLPASGYTKDSQQYGLGNYGDYWTASMSGTGSVEMYITNHSVTLGDWYRKLGLAVRPVCAFSISDVADLKIDHNKLSIAVNSENKLDVIPLNSIGRRISVNGLSVDWVSSNRNVATVTDGMVKAVAAGTCTITASVGNISAECSVTVKDPSTVTPESVDLGLSVKWATFNIGAFEPEMAGDYYAWGAIDTTSEYTMKRYKFFIEYDENDNEQFSKYVTDTLYGKSDNITVLDAADDVANVKWGGNWRMPLSDEMEELINKCSWEWTEYNGVYGYKVTSKVTGFTDRSIFLPAAGYFSNTILGLNSYGRYWSGSLYTYHNAGAYILGMADDKVFCSPYYRHNGYSVRAVSMFDISDVKGIRISTGELSLALGAEKILKVIPIDVSGRGIAINDELEVNWYSDDPDVAIVVNDTVKAIGGGTCTITVRYGAYTDECTVTVEDPSQVTPVSVDLGLSVKWAAFNLGAFKPEMLGDYYAWGELEPYYEAGYAESTSPVWKVGKESGYNWTSYFDTDDDGATMIKYGSESDKTVLEPEDDAARVKWGISWRIPSADEIKELIDSCTWVKVDSNGVEGYKVTSKVKGYENNSIFLPLTGYREDTDLDGVGTSGYYWSSTANPNDLTVEVFDLGNSIYDDDRYWGQSYRPVQLYEESEIDGLILNVSDSVLEIGDKMSLYAKGVLDGRLKTITGSIIWSSDNESVATVDAYGNITAVAPGNATIKATYGELSKECDVTVNNLIFTVTGQENSKDYVDLGLSVKWATYNVGATTPTEYGDYFAWGEVEPYYVDGYAQSKVAVWKDNIYNGYWCDKYKYDVYSIVDNKVTYTMTKYCCDSDHGYQGFTDNKVTLEPEDDVAHVQWGGNWRMPSIYEFSELYYNCTWKNVIIDGVAGYKITSNVEGYEGRFIFMPMSGFRDMLALEQIGDYGSYWSSTLFESSAVFALGLSFSSEGLDEEYDLSGSLRYCGNSVRPVCPKE